MTTEEPTSTLRWRGGDAAEETTTSHSELKKIEKLKTLRTVKELISDHPEIQRVTSTSTTSTTTTTTTTTLKTKAASAAGTVLYYLLKPVFFLTFALLHLWNELMISARTMKTMAQVFFLPHLFPTSPELVRILRKDLRITSTDQSNANTASGTALLAKLPKHLAVILPADSTSEAEEEEWHSIVAQLAQWSVASGIKCLSIMRTDALTVPMVQLLREGINDHIAEFYKEEPKKTPVVLVRTLRPVEEDVHSLLISGNASSRPLLHGGKHYDLDVVILSESDGHDRLAGNVRALGRAALRDEIDSEDITIEFLEQRLSAELSEPELLIIFKDDLDLHSYPPWHIRLTEI
ncbi:hypothetical protein BGZ83_010763 [Gryganskiella cystojenkinii]|nr:hypothetical protein BGZ83_010763 [Gryganskiella cystojenkinii]